MSGHATAWAFVPARGGSKSIPLKNLVELGGRPLMSYGVCAAQESAVFERIVCSTDYPQIADLAYRLGIEVDQRPAELCGDDADVSEVAREFLSRQASPLPDFLYLIQPTSPFLLAEHIRLLRAALENDPGCKSGHTVSRAPHNFHFWNSRRVADGRVEFFFAEERASGYNKQRKPACHYFGNLIAARCSALLRGESFFAKPMAAVEIPQIYSFDLDKPEDIAVAQALIDAKSVSLPDSFSRKPDA